MMQRGEKLMDAGLVGAEMGVDDGVTCLEKDLKGNLMSGVQTIPAQYCHRNGDTG